MSQGSLVRCVEGYPGVLEEGSMYTVSFVTPKGNVLLYEVEPPDPYTSFKKERFMEVQDPEEGNIIIKEFNTIPTTITYDI